MLSIIAAQGSLGTREHVFGSHAASLCTHVALIGCAVLLSGRATQMDTTRIIPVDQPVWTNPSSGATARPVHTPGSPRIVRPLVPALVVPAVPTSDIPPSPVAPTVDPALYPAAVRLPVSEPDPAPSPSAPVSVSVVEEIPVLLRFPPPRYPDILRQAGVEGRVMLELVLDTLGHVEPGSVQVVSSTHRLFDAAATQAALGSTYSPGRVAGRAVRVRIQVPVVFALRRR